LLKNFCGEQPRWRGDGKELFFVGADRKMMAVAVKAVPTASLICVTMCRWYGEHGRLEDMKPTIERLLPHATGMPRIILRGHLGTIATNQGDYRTGLVAVAPRAV
jgi:hypothetical protein